MKLRECYEPFVTLANQRVRELYETALATREQYSHNPDVVDINDKNPSFQQV